MQPRPARALPGLALTLAVAAAIATGCSSNDTGTSPPPSTTDPTFSFAFPAAGTSLSSPGTSNKRIFTASEVGSWAYRCIPHGSGGMTGTVVVDAASANDSAVVAVGQGGAIVFSPSTVTIKPGGYVRWVNVSSMLNHTVTRP